MGAPVKLNLLGDRPRTLRFDINSLDAVESMLGAEVGDMLEGGTIGLKIRATRGLLWGALLHEEPRITPAEVGDLIQAHLDAGGTMATVYDGIRAALEASGVIRTEPTSNGGAPGNAGAPSGAAR